MNIGELVAYLRLDDSQFQGRISGASRAVNSLKSVGAATGQALSTAFTAATTTTGALITNLVKTGFGYNSLQQNSRAALKQVLGSTEAVNKQMGKLDDFARNSPFGKDVFIRAQQQMLGFGVAADKVIPALNAIQNAVAANGLGAAEIERATYTLSQMKSQGKLTGKTLQELGLLGIDAAQIIGDQMGKTSVEIKEMASKPGGIPVDQVWDPLVKGLETKFGGTTDNIKQQWTGAVDRIKGANRDLGAELARPFVDPNGGGQAVVWANLVADLIRGVEAHVKTAMPIVEQYLGKPFDALTNKLKAANSAIAGFNMQGLLSQVDKLTKYTPLISGASTALFMLGLKPVPVLNGLSKGLIPVIAGIAALAATSPELRGVGEAFVSAFSPAIPALKEVVTVTADLAMQLINAVAPGLTAVAESGGRSLAAIASLAPALLNLLSAGVPVVGMLADMVGWVAQLPTPVLAGVAAFAAFKSLGLPAVFMNLGKVAKSSLHMVSESFAATKALGAAFGQEMGVVKTALLAGKVAALQFGGALKSLVISNAPMLAITALTTVIGVFMQKAADAKARTEAYSDALRDLAPGTEAATRSISDLATELVVTGDATNWGWFQKVGDGAASLEEAIRKAGSSAREWGDSVAGTQEQSDNYRAALEAGAEAAGLNAAATSKMLKTYDEHRESQVQAQLMQDALTEAGLNGAAAADANAEATRRNAEAVDQLRQADQQAAAAKGDLRMAQYATKDAMEAVTKAIEENREAAIGANGVVDESSAAFRAFDESMIAAERAWRSQIDAAVKAKAPQSEINDLISTARGELEQQATAFYGSKDAADAYLNALEVIPDVVSSVVKLDTDAAYSDAEALVESITDSKGYIKIDARTDEAQQRLLESLGLVGDSEGVYTINAEDNPALSVLLASLGEVDTSTGTISIDGNDKDAMQRLADAVISINTSKGTVSILGKDKTATVIAEAQRNINAAQGHVKIYGQDYATGLADTIISNINGKTAYIKINGQKVANGYQGGQLMADGGILRQFAQGTEKHVAQIARAGEYRLWAEPETGGEAYIPLSPSKRARSTDILAAVASEFGYFLTPNNVTQYADGSPTGNPDMSALSAAKALGQQVSALTGDISGSLTGLADATNTQMSNVIEALAGVVDFMSGSFKGGISKELAAISALMVTQLPEAGNVLHTRTQGNLSPLLSWVEGKLKPGITNAMNAMQTAFMAVPSAVVSSWARIKSGTASPTNYVISTVYMNGLRSAVNAIASSTGIGVNMPAVRSVGYASGGVLPGYTPGRDIYDFYNPQVGTLRLSGGEAILRPEVVKALGGAPTINAWNRSRGVGISNKGDRGYASGGILDFLHKGSNGWSVNAKHPDFSFSLFDNPKNAISQLVTQPTREYANRAGGGQVGRAFANSMPALADALGPSLVRKINALGGGGAGLVAAARKALGVPYVWGGSSIPPGLDCSGLVYWAYQQMGKKNVPRLTAAGYQSVATPVSSPRAGDVIFWGNPAHHIAIATSAGQMVHAPKPGDVVRNAAIYGNPTFGRLKYDQGGMLPPGLTLVENRTGKPEPVFTHDQFEDMRMGVRDVYFNVDVSTVQELAEATDAMKTLSLKLKMGG